MHIKEQNSAAIEITMSQALIAIMRVVFGVFMIILLFITLFSAFAF